MNSTPLSDLDIQETMRGLVHELRNPLSAILTATALLNGNPALDEESSVLLEVVRNEARRTNSILTEFANFVKTPHTHPEALDVAAVTRVVVRELADTLDPFPNVVDQLPDRLEALADLEQFRRALTQVIKNAVEAMPDGGTLTLRFEPAGEFLCITVLDTGPGFNDSVSAHAFQPFFTTKSQGTGLGLPVARAALRAFGGEVQLQLAQGGGHVRLLLPDIPAVNQSTPSTASANTN